MSFVLVYLKLYARSVVDAVKAIGKNAWTLLLPIGLVAVYLFVGQLLGRIPVIGGLLMGLIYCALLSAYSYFVAGLVGRQRVGVSQLKTALGAYFWSWISLFFVLFIVGLVLRTLVRDPAKLTQLTLALSMLELVALNAVPEVIALKGTRGGLETVQRSFKFLQESWVEWFVPNGLVLAAYFYLSMFGLLQVLVGGAGFVVNALVGGVVLHVYMVFRGFLFEALDGSTHRQRMYKFRNG